MPSPSEQADAVLNGEGQTQAPRLTARELAMEKIAGENIARVSKDFEDMDPSLYTNSDDEDLDPDNPDALQRQLEAPKPVAPVAPVAAQPAVKTIKVDGEERQVTDDELIRSYQKNQAADRRLEEASQLLREANARAEALAAQVAAPAQVKQPVVDTDVQAKVKGVLSKLYEGDEDSAASALTDLIVSTRGGDQPTPAAPQLDIDQLTLQIQQNMAIDTAFKTIQSDYPDLISDPDLEMLTAMKINRAVASGTPRAAAMIAAAEEVYKSVGKVATGRQVEDPKPTPNARLENKARLDLVRPASGTASAKDVPGEEESPSSVIAQMANQRMSPAARRA